MATETVAVPPLPDQGAAFTDSAGRPTDPAYRWMRAQDRSSRVVISETFADITHSVLSTDRTLEDYWKGLPSVLDLGLVADGSDNGASRYDAMLDYCDSNGIGALLVPQGDYTFSTYPNRSLSVSLIGVGSGKARFLRNFSGTSDQGLLEPASGVTVRDLSVIGGTTGSNLVIKGAAQKVTLAGLDLGGTATNGLRINSASRVSIIGCGVSGGAVSITSLEDSAIELSRAEAVTLASMSGCVLNIGHINGNLSIDAGCTNNRLHAGLLSGTYSNSSATTHYTDGKVGSRFGDDSNGGEYLPNHRIRKWMTGNLNTSFVTFGYASLISGDVPFTATPRIMGVFPGGASVASLGWQNNTSTGVDVRASASGAAKIVAEGPY